MKKKDHSGAVSLAYEIGSEFYLQFIEDRVAAISKIMHLYKGMTPSVLNDVSELGEEIKFAL